MRALCAERRWVMSGTPAKGTSVQLGLSSLYGLLSFVGHPVCADGGRQWRREYAAPLERGAEGGAARLRALLRGVVVRHTADAAAIPPPERTLVLLPCSAAERRAYNTVLSYVAANIALTALGAPPIVSIQVSIASPSTCTPHHPHDQNPILAGCQAAGGTTSRCSTSHSTTDRPSASPSASPRASPSAVTVHQQCIVQCKHSALKA